jgi:hypothetical protein
MVPKNIKKEHILQVINEIDQTGVPPKRKSTKFFIKHNDRFYRQ